MSTEDHKGPIDIRSGLKNVADQEIDPRFDTPEAQFIDLCYELYGFDEHDFRMLLDAFTQLKTRDFLVAWDEELNKVRFIRLQTDRAQDWIQSWKDGMEYMRSKGFIPNKVVRRDEEDHDHNPPNDS